MKTILAMGQSNAVGAGTGGVWSFPASVTVWNCAADTDVLTGLGTAFIAPVRASAPFIGANNNNMMVHACRYLAAELGEDVQLILVAKSGTAISAWSAGAMYTRMQAVLNAAGVTCVDAFLWHQGEANIGTEATYHAAWDTLVGRLTSDGYITTDTPIVVGELAVPHAAMNAVLRSLAGGRVGFADIGAFNILPDGYHYTGVSLVRAGLELAREVMKLPGPMNVTVEDETHPYVSGAGCGGYVASSGVLQSIKIGAENGQKSLMQAGAFVADRLGVWEFDARGYPGTARYILCLLDETGAFVQSLAGTGGVEPAGNIAYVCGHGIVALGSCDKVYLGVVHYSAGTATVTAINSAIWNRMTVRYLGRN